MFVLPVQVVLDAEGVSVGESRGMERESNHLPPVVSSTQQHVGAYGSEHAPPFSVSPFIREARSIHLNLTYLVSRQNASMVSARLCGGLPRITLPAVNWVPLHGFMCSSPKTPYLRM